MIWPFRKKVSQAEEFLSLMEQYVPIVADKWSYFNKTLKFKNSVPLRDIIAAFSVPAIEGLKQNEPKFRKSPDSALFLLIACGIVSSGTNSKQEVEQALGVTIPFEL